MQFEKLVLQSDSLRVEVLPELGGKISSLFLLSEQEELLQKPLAPYATRTQTMAFEEGDASGIDECIPTVSASEVEGNRLPDHGDFWRVPFRYRQEGATLILDAEGFSLPLHFEKRLTLEGDRLEMAYRLRNTGTAPVSYLWSAHPGFAVEAGDRILLPDSVSEITVWYSAGPRLGEPGTRHSWPEAKDVSGAAVDLSLVGGANDNVGDKLFASAPREGWAAIERRRLGRKVEIRFDPAVTPYLGLWLAYGGWPVNRENRQHCVAVEPCTAPADALATAIDRGRERNLGPGDIWEWKIEVHVLSA
jgi:galactose mutarotase-like enzyme